jgi:hypothetical protein
MLIMDPLGIWKVQPGTFKGRPYSCYANMARAASIWTRCGLKYTIITHEAHEGVDIVAVPGGAECR